MKIKKITKIKGCRTFHEFAWPSTLGDFKEHNLIYGWNGTGKTTISDIFRTMEKKHNHLDGEFAVETESGTLKSSDLGESGWAALIPPIRVFNRDYVTANVFPPSNGEMAPIFYLGEESVGKQMQVESLKNEVTVLGQNLSLLREDHRKKDAAVTDLCVTGGQSVKLALLGSDSAYNNYDKRNFIKKLESLGSDLAPHLLTEAQEIELKGRINGVVKGNIIDTPLNFPDLPMMKKKANDLIVRSVASEIIGALQANERIAHWVKEGLEIHKNHQYTDCQFCLQPLPATRVKELEGHFNDEYTRIMADIAAELGKIDTSIAWLEKYRVIESNTICDHMKTRWDEVAALLQSSIDEYLLFMKALREKLARKQANPFENVASDDAIPLDASKVYEKYLELLQEHNDWCDNHDADVIAARKTQEAAIVASYIERHVAAKKEATDAENAIKASQDKIEEINGDIDRLEREIRGHRKSADEINDQLRQYLGHDELKLETKENGYTISRFGVLAKDLSEGERTAIALLHFLKSLEDQNFKPKGIVVIDDPVTSMDDGALFHAFGYIKDKTKDTKQLFILTHNFMFFRQVKGWFKFADQNTPRKVSYYQTTCAIEGDKRRSQLGSCDKLLTKYETEYHYLFSLVENASHDPGTDELEKFYPMPNVARRMLESFLAFRKPSKNNFHAMLEATDYDPAQRSRLYRFVNAHSHDDHIAATEHDPTLLAETPQIMKSVLALMEHVDRGHYTEMMQVIGKPVPALVVAPTAVAA